MSQKKQTSEREKIIWEAKIEMIDYILETFCVSELGEMQRIYLKDIRYSLQTKLDETHK